MAEYNYSYQKGRIILSNVVLKDVECSNRTPLWKNRDFMMIWSGTSISTLTFQFYLIVLPLIIIDETKSSLGTGMMRAVEFLPNVLLAALLGVVVDRFNRKRIMQLAVSIECVVLSILLALILTHDDRPWEVYVLAFLVSTAGYTFGNAYHSVLPQLIDKAQLTSANASLTLVNSLISISGPVVAGILIGIFGYTEGIVASICGAVILLVMTKSVRLHQGVSPRDSTETTFWQELREGWAQLVSSKALWVMTIMILLMNVSSATTGAVMLFYARDNLRVPTWGVGVIFASSAVGALMASLIAKQSRRWSGRGVLMLSAICIQIAGQVTLFISVHWFTVAVGMLLIGFGTGFINIHYLTLRQEVTPNHLLGRVAGASSTMMKLAVPLSFVLSGFVGTLVPANYMFLVAACILGAIFVYGIVRGLQKYA